MDIIIFTLLSYFAAGIVFITREADLQIIDPDSTTQNLQHPVLRLSAGMIMMILWPVFLDSEMMDTQRSPMAVRIDVQLLK